MMKNLVLMCCNVKINVYIDISYKILKNKYIIKEYSKRLLYRETYIYKLKNHYKYKDKNFL